MMTSPERNRLATGGLLIAASIAIGAASGEWTPEPGIDVPMLSVVHAQPPVTPTTDSPARSEAPKPAASDAPTSAAQAADEPAVTATVVKDPAIAGADAPMLPEALAEEALLVLEGGASWYSDALAGRLTASGEPYDPAELIAAHRALPFGTRLRVTNLDNERSVEVVVIDRGPFVAGRILDLSRSAAEQIGIIRAGHGRVRVEVLEYGG